MVIFHKNFFCIFSTFSPHYFKHIKISALALLKMVMHSRSGGNLEVMGLLLGKVDGNTMIVMDSFALPVEGTETRVNAQAQAYEYMAAYTEAAKQVLITNLCRLQGSARAG
jgi:COP9 signalosome complex subunit 5